MNRRLARIASMEPSRERDGDSIEHVPSDDPQRDASMEPSRERDGDAADASTHLKEKVDMLQWSRRANATETEDWAPPELDWSQLQWSRRANATETPLRFHPAGAVEALQWSRRANATETPRA